MGGAGVLVLLGGGAGGWRWRCEVWQGWQAVGAVQVAAGWRRRVVIGCGAGAAGGLLLAGGAGGRGDLLRWWCAGAVIGQAARSSGRAGLLLIRQAGQAAGRGRWAKEKGQGGGAWCAAALAFCLRWRCDLLRRAHRCGRWAGCPGISPTLPGAAGAGTDPGATVPAGNVPAWHGLRWRCSIRCVFAVCRRGQILHLTG